MIGLPLIDMLVESLGRPCWDIHASTMANAIHDGTVGEIEVKVKQLWNDIADGGNCCHTHMLIATALMMREHELVAEEAARSPDAPRRPDGSPGMEHLTLGILVTLKRMLQTAVDLADHLKAAAHEKN